MQDINYIVVDYMGPWTYEGTRIYTDKRKEQKVKIYRKNAVLQTSKYYRLVRYLEIDKYKSHDLCVKCPELSHTLLSR